MRARVAHRHTGAFSLNADGHLPFINHTGVGARLGVGELSEVVVSNAAHARAPVRFRGRSYLAFVLAPEPPIADWLADLERSVNSSAGFFLGRPAVLDLASVTLSPSAIAHLIWPARDARHPHHGHRGATPDSWAQACHRVERAAALPPSMPAAPRRADPVRERAASLLLDSPVRSGQSVVFPQATSPSSARSPRARRSSPAARSTSTARCAAAPSPARPATPRARIFCSKLEAELLAIDGLYQTADDMDAESRGRPVQAWLEGDTMTMAALD